MKMKFFIVLITLSFILKVCVLVEGRYIVEVRLNGYANPSGKCNSNDCHTESGQTCCDSDDTGKCMGRERCDSYFVYCLRPLGEVDLGCFENQTRAVSEYNEDDKMTNIDFSQSRVLGLSNPQNLSGLGDGYKGIQVYIDVIDADPLNDQPNEYVDSLLINHNLTVAEPLQVNHRGIKTTVTMDLRVTVFCAENFGGLDCTQCVPGLTGPDCNETDYCFGVNCSGNGECRNTDNSFQCTCDPGFSGERCQANIDDCNGVDCSGNGVCVDGVNSFTCKCDPGFRGLLCSEVDRMSIGTSISTGRVGAGAIAGGVVGALLAVLVLLILVIVTVVIILKYYKNNFKAEEINNQGSGSGFPMPGDNPVYEPAGNTTSELKGSSSPHTTTVVTALPVSEGGGPGGNDSSVEERRFDNLIYGDEDETDDGVYTTPFDQQDQPNHEFDNPIYGTETYDT